MSGAVILSAGCAENASGGGVVIPGPLAWGNIYGDLIGHNNSQTLTLITTPISITATKSGGGTLGYSLNGGGATYAGAFNAAAGDTLAWSIRNLAGTLTASGTVSVANASDGGAALGSFSFVVTGKNYS